MYQEIKIDLPSSLPSKVEELFHFSVGFENLIKTINYLHNYNLALLSELKNINKRILKLEDIKDNIEQLNIKNEVLESTNKKHEVSLISMQNKFLEYEDKFKLFEKRIKISEENDENFSSNLNRQSKVIDKINISLEETRQKINDFNKYNSSYFKKRNNGVNHQNFEGNYKKAQGENKSELPNEIVQGEEDNEFQDDINKNFETINKDLINQGKLVENLQKDCYDNKKVSQRLREDFTNKSNELEEKINNIINNLYSGSGGDGSPRRIKKSGGGPQEGVFKITMAQMEKDQKKFNEFISDYKINHEKYEKEYASVRKALSEYKNKFLTIQQLIDNEKYNNKILYASNDELKKINYNLLELTNIVNSNPNKDDLEKLKATLNKKIEKIKTSLKSGDDIINNKGGSKPQEEDQKIKPGETKISSSLSMALLDFLETGGKNIDMSQNKQILELLQLNQKNAEDITKNNKNFLEITNLLLSSQNEKQIKEIKDSIEILQKNSDNNKKKIIEIAEMIGEKELDEEISENEKEKEGEEDISGNNRSLWGRLKQLNESYQSLREKITVIDKKNNQINKEMRNDIKNNLKSESIKVVEQFKSKLDNFTKHFEFELKNKIDKIGLNVFETKINTKISSDLKEKLSKNELRKNNHVINKKIDSLENKISRTLVDTIIDLQMDEAPLIVKTNKKNVELCASCNQPLSRNNYNTLTDLSATYTVPNKFNSPRLLLRPKEMSLKNLPNIVFSPRK